MTSLNGICGSVEIIAVNYHFRFLVWHVLFDSLFKRFFSRKNVVDCIDSVEIKYVVHQKWKLFISSISCFENDNKSIGCNPFHVCFQFTNSLNKNAFSSVLLFWWIFEICFKFSWEWKSGILYTWHEFDRDVSLFFREISQLLGSFPDFTNFTNFHDWSPLGVISLKFRENRENTINFDAIFSHKNSKRLINSTPLKEISKSNWWQKIWNSRVLIILNSCELSKNNAK